MALTTPTPTGGPSRKGKKWLVLLVILVVLAAVVVWAVWFWPKPAASGYQAVFLSNGQVYFGKLVKANRAYAELTDIYYLQLRKPLQTQEPPAEGETAQSQLTLVKLGNELHGPIDVMKINKDHILFVETLKPDSKVAQAIEEYKKSQAAK